MSYAINMLKTRLSELEICDETDILLGRIEELKSAISDLKLLEKVADGSDAEKINFVLSHALRLLNNDQRVVLINELTERTVL